MTRVRRPRRGFKACDATQATLAEIEWMHRCKTQQMMVEAGDEDLTATAPFDTLAGS